MLNIALKVAGGGLVLIALANLMAFKKLGWSRNLKHTELFFSQVFRVHTFYMVLTLLGMATVCLFATEELMNSETLITRGLRWFLTLFWAIRVIFTLTYYEKSLMRANPWWTALFTAAFVYLTGVFLTTAIL